MRIFITIILSSFAFTCSAKLKVELMAGAGMNSNPKISGTSFTKTTTTPILFSGSANVLYGINKWDFGVNTTIQPIKTKYNDIIFTYGNPAIMFQAIAYRHVSLFRVGISVGYAIGNKQENTTSFIMKSGFTAGIHAGINKSISNNISVIADISGNWATFNNGSINQTDINTKPMNTGGITCLYENLLIGLSISI